MRITTTLPTFVRVCILVPAIVIGWLLSNPALGGDEDRPKNSAAPGADVRFPPYAADPEHLWNRLHQGLFVREKDGSRHIHETDPLLYRGGTHLLEGESHRKALALLDEFLAKSDGRLIDDPLPRLFFQHDLWAAFDYVAWYPDDWVFKSKYEPAAVALRNWLAKGVGRLALDDRELAALPDNYALAVKSKQYGTAYDPDHPKKPFLPPNLFEATGPWVRFHVTTVGEVMTPQHFDGAGGRSAHVVFLRLPEGRAATEQYLKELRRDAVKQFPPGTAVALVRRALTVDRSAKVRVTPVTELVQIRVYRRIPEDPEADINRDIGEQDVYEFVLDRQKLFAGEHGLVAVGPDDPAKPFFSRSEGHDPYERPRNSLTPGGSELKTCIGCHQAPGVYSVLSMTNPRRQLRGSGSDLFRTYAWDVELNYTMHAKVKRFDWGLLQGKLEAK
jgi:hypothetical protein